MHSCALEHFCFREKSPAPTEVKFNYSPIGWVMGTMHDSQSQICLHLQQKMSVVLPLHFSLFNPSLKGPHNELLENNLN